MSSMVMLGDLVAAALGLLCALFGLYLVLFTDLSGSGERLQAWLYAGLVYAVAGFVLAVLWPRHRRRWRLWLGIPAVLVAGRFVLAEPGTALWDLAALAAAILGLLAGTAAAARMRPPSA